MHDLLLHRVGEAGEGLSQGLARIGPDAIVEWRSPAPWTRWRAMRNSGFPSSFPDERPVRPNTTFFRIYDAGRQLAERLMPYEKADPIVLALPHGGVPVAFEVAKAL